jgi:hypothetical protein
LSRARETGAPGIYATAIVVLIDIASLFLPAAVLGGSALVAIVPLRRAAGHKALVKRRLREQHDLGFAAQRFLSTSSRAR